MRFSTRARAEDFWASRLSIPAALLRTPGLHLLAHPLPDGFFILGRGESRIALAPPALHSGLAALGFERLLDRASLLELLPPGARCIGPTFVGYTEIEPPAPLAPMVAFSDASAGAFESLRAGVSDEEWQHAGLEKAVSPILALVEHERVVCAAGADVLLGSVAHIGVVTHAGARCRGLARQTVAALTRAVLARGMLPQYQTLISNAASLSVAKALGFESFVTTFGGSLQAEPVFHLTSESELRDGSRSGAYWPARFAADGFVHCSATPAIVLAVARAFYAGVAEPLLVLRIEPSRLTSRLRFEPAAPPEPPGIAPGTLFPHVYGPIDLAAVSGVGALERRGQDLIWPQRFGPLK